MRSRHCLTLAGMPNEHRPTQEHVRQGDQEPSVCSTAFPVKERPPRQPADMGCCSQSLAWKTTDKVLSQGSFSPGHRQFSLWRSSKPTAKTQSLRGTLGGMCRGGRVEERLPTKGIMGERSNNHPSKTRCVFSSLLEYIFPPSCSIKRNEEKKTCCNFLCHSTRSGKRPDPLLHFPICTNGQSDGSVPGPDFCSPSS